MVDSGNVTVNGKTFYLDGILKDNLDRLNYLATQDFDNVIVVDGAVGSGKSVFTQICAYYGSKGKLTMDKVTFSPQEFREAVLKCEKYDHIIFDEAFRGLSGRATMTQTNRILIEMLQEIRQKNLTIWIVLPSIWDLDSYVSKHRCRGLFNIYMGKNLERGYFRFYAKETIRYFLANSKQKYTYPPYKNRSFWGRFKLFYPLGEQEYRDRKYKAFQTPDQHEMDKSIRFKDQCDATWYALKKDMGMNYSQIARLFESFTEFPVTYKQIGRRIEHFAKKKGFLDSTSGRISYFNRSKDNDVADIDDTPLPPIPNGADEDDSDTP